MTPQETTEKLMVAVYGSPFSLKMIEWTKAHCDSVGALWFGGYVDTGAPISRAEQILLERNIDHVKKLGAEVVTTQDQDPARGLVRLAKRNQATGLVVGTRPGRLQKLPATKTLTQKLIDLSETLTIHVLRYPTEWKEERRNIPSKPLVLPIRHLLTGAFLVIALTALGLLLVPAIDHAMGLVFLLTVCLSALYFSIPAVVFTSILSGLAWNYFFIPPRFTWTIGSAEDWVTYIATGLISIIIGVLTAKKKEGYAALEQEELKVSELYRLTTQLSHCRSLQETASVAVAQVSRTFSCEAGIFLRSADGKSVPVTWQNSIQPTDAEQKLIEWVAERRESTGRFNNLKGTVNIYAIALPGLEGNVGTMAVRFKKESVELHEKALIEHFSKQIAIAIEREFFHESFKKAKVLEETERVYNTLLNSVSHELKTPLAAIEGSATAMLDPQVAKNPGAVASLAEEVKEGSIRLQSLIKNLLDMSRVESQTIKLNLEPVEVGDLIGVTAKRLATELSKHPFKIDVSEGIDPLQGDFVLLEQALRNLLENACRYTNDGAAISVSATGEGEKVILRVRDEGPGIALSPPDRVFQKFVRGSEIPGGTGLGLTIVKAIVELHGGTIEVTSSEKGTEFKIVLPATSNVDLKSMEIQEGAHGKH